VRLHLRTQHQHTGGVAPLVSVVLIFLNEERFLEEAVLSLRNQTLTDWELILVDDGSTDRSTPIARDLAAHDDRIRYVDHQKHANRGMAASRNVGVANSSAPYLAFIDGDDVWAPSKLAEQVALLERMPDVAMVNGALCFWHSWDPRSTKADRHVLTGEIANRRLDPPEAALTIHPLAPTSPAGVDLLVRRSVFDAVGGFEESFRGMFEDQSFLIKVFLRYPVYISSSAWLLYRQHDESSCAQTTRVSYVRLRGVFLDWLEDEVQRLGDPHLSEAVRRARRELRFRKLLAPGLQMLDELRARIPDGYRDRMLGCVPDRYEDRVKRTLRRARDVWRRWWL
jgi:glycosyltransferase involved in cell wall biosynthesis